MQTLRILLVQLGSNGDCLFATTIARQIKEVDYPGCHLTWMIGDRYKSVLKNNPFIDSLIELPIKALEDIVFYRERIQELIEREKIKKHYDYIFVTDYAPINYKKWFGTTRSSIFRNYPNPLKINPQPLIYLTSKEQKHVKEFCQKNDINSDSYNILFECSPQSGQSKMTFNLAFEIANQIVTRMANCKIILSSANQFESNHNNIIDGSSISWRENAELINYCDLLIGCSSGITWLSCTQWAKKTPMVQIIDPSYMDGRVLASVYDDYVYFGLDTKHILEMNNPCKEIIIDCVITILIDSFSNAKARYHSKKEMMFMSRPFLMESRISNLKKYYFLLKLHLLPGFIKFYRAHKPKWFRPCLFLNKIIEKMKNI